MLAGAAAAAAILLPGGWKSCPKSSGKEAEELMTSWGHCIPHGLPASGLTVEGNTSLSFLRNCSSECNTSD